MLDVGVVGVVGFVGPVGLVGVVGVPPKLSCVVDVPPLAFEQLAIKTDIMIAKRQLIFLAFFIKTPLFGFDILA